MLLTIIEAVNVNVGENDAPTSKALIGGRRGQDRVSHDALARGVPVRRGWNDATRSRPTLLVAMALGAALTLALPAMLAAQRRPGVGMGFYTTTGLPTADVEGGSVNSSTATARAPSFALSVLATTGVKRVPKRALVAGARVSALSLGNGSSCILIPGTERCQSPRFTERGALLVGGAFDIRATVLRAMVGPALYSVQREGTRVGTSLRVDFAAPRLSGPTPTLFFTRTFLGSQRGEAVGMSTLGAGFRWVRKS